MPREADMRHIEISTYDHQTANHRRKCNSVKKRNYINSNRAIDCYEEEIYLKYFMNVKWYPYFSVTLAHTIFAEAPISVPFPSGKFHPRKTSF